VKYKPLDHVDRCLNQEGNVVFMYLGRGISKAESTYYKEGRTSFIEQKESYERDWKYDVIEIHISIGSGDRPRVIV